MDRDFFKDIYQDFFGENGQPGSVPPGPPAASGDDAVRRANEALEEMKKLVAESGKYFGAGTAEGTGTLDCSGQTGNPGKAAGMAEAGEKNPVAPEQEAGGKGCAEAQGDEGKTRKGAGAEEEEEDPMDELNALIGLTSIKKDVAELMDFVKIQKLRKDQGLKSVPVSLHLVFTGNPGTGKTTVARIIAKLYRQIGVLPKGQLVEVDRSGLVAGYVGQTAIRTSEQIEKAMGGVLFIDEAYSLAKKDDAFGQEAIDTILKAMEDHRDEFVVIVAGYTEPMEQFINSNPGLRSRFNKYIEFPDYSGEELYEIFLMNCRKYDYVLAEGAEELVKARIGRMCGEKKEHFANAREIRNFFEAAVTRQARRLAAAGHPSSAAMKEITAEDVADPAEAAGEAASAGSASCGAGSAGEAGTGVASAGDAGDCAGSAGPGAGLAGEAGTGEEAASDA